MDGLYALRPGRRDAGPGPGHELRPERGPDGLDLPPAAQGVLFDDGSRLDANDVVLSFAVQWDAEHPLHRGGRRIRHVRGWFGGFLHPPAPPPAGAIDVAGQRRRRPPTRRPARPAADPSGTGRLTCATR